MFVSHTETPSFVQNVDEVRRVRKPIATSQFQEESRGLPPRRRAASPPGNATSRQRDWPARLRSCQATPESRDPSASAQAPRGCRAEPRLNRGDHDAFPSASARMPRVRQSDTPTGGIVEAQKAI